MNLTLSETPKTGFYRDGAHMRPHNVSLKLTDLDPHYFKVNINMGLEGKTTHFLNPVNTGMIFEFVRQINFRYNLKK